MSPKPSKACTTKGQGLPGLLKASCSVELKPGAPIEPIRASNKPLPQAQVPTPSTRRTPKPTLARAARSRDNMFVQAGAFGLRSNADALADKIRAQGIDGVIVSKDDSGGRTLYRVRIGPVTGVDHYDWMVARMADLGIHDAYLAIE